VITLKRVLAILFGASVLAASAWGGYYYWYLNLRPISVAKDAIKKKLSDPESAQWRNVRLVESIAVCGEVNAKNRLGGYVGFTPFLVLVVDQNTYVTVAQGMPEYLPQTAEGTKLQRELMELERKNVTDTCEKSKPPNA
jgi:hypothetical protein